MLYLFDFVKLQTLDVNNKNIKLSDLFIYLIIFLLHHIFYVFTWCKEHIFS